MNPMSLLTMSTDHLREQSLRQHERNEHMKKPMAKIAVAIVLFSLCASTAIAMLAH